jgi:hypothetical protein
MFKNFCIERPKQRRLVPAWDLGIVLKALQLSPFEPLDLISFNFLTYKCCFLLALPSRTLPNRKITPEFCRLVISGKLTMSISKFSKKIKKFLNSQKKIKKFQNSQKYFKNFKQI